MKRSILNKLLLAGCLLAMVSCKAKKLATAALPVDVPPTISHVPAATPALGPVVIAKNNNRMNAARAAQLTFNTFSAKAAAKLDIDGDKNDVDINIRIDHDKKIWVSITKTVFVTIDVARVVITPDSLMFVDKIHGTYEKKPFSYLYQYTNNQVSYKMLEALLTGNTIPEVLQDSNASFQADNGLTTLAGTLQDLVYSLLLGTDMKPTQFNLSNHNAGLSLQENNSMFIPVGGKIVPSQIDILSAAQNKKIQVNLHYTKVDLDLPLTYPFSIPANYTTDGN